MNKSLEIVWSVLRVLFGWTFIWAFIDKIFGFGFATEAGKAWIDGVSPTYGFLMYATKGPFAEIYQGLAGSTIVTWLYMLGLLFAGFTLLFGVLVRLGALAGFALYILFYTAGFIPPEHNPVIDEHIINATVMVGLYLSVPSTHFGFGRMWQRIRLVRRFPILR